MLTLFAVGFLVIGAGLLAMGVSFMRRGRGDQQEVQGWTPAFGTVVGVQREDLQRGTADYNLTLRYAVVRYVDEYGREQEGRAQTAASWQPPREGARVGLRYDPRDPRRVVLDGAPVGKGPLSAVAGVVFILFGVFWLFIGLLILGLNAR